MKCKLRLLFGDPSKDLRFVVPVSLTQAHYVNKNFKISEKFKALLDDLKKGYDATIVIADILDCYNGTSPEEAVKNGEDLERQILRHIGKNHNSLKVTHWKSWTENNETFNKKENCFLERLSEKSNYLRVNLEKTADKFSKETSKENSIKLLTEECSVYLQWSELFTHVLYPLPISDALKKTASLFGLKLKYVQLHWNEAKKSCAENETAFFSQSGGKEARLTFGSRILIQNVESLLLSSEVNKQEKTKFLKHLFRQIQALEPGIVSEILAPVEERNEPFSLEVS